MLTEKNYNKTMPEFSGIDIINALNNSGRIKEQKICILTASSVSDNELEKLKKKGCKKILKKPLELNSLVEMLEKFLIRIKVL